MIQISCVGHLGNDVEERKKEGQSFYVFSIGVSLTKDKTQWVSCTLAYSPSFVQFLKKGAQVFVAGTYANVFSPNTGSDPTLQIRAYQVRIIKFAKEGDTQRDEKQKSRIDEHSETLRGQGQRVADRGYQTSAGFDY